MYATISSSTSVFYFVSRTFMDSTKTTAMMNCAVRPPAIKNFCKWSAKSMLINHILTLVTHNKSEHIIYDDDVLVLRCTNIISRCCFPDAITSDIQIRRNYVSQIVEKNYAK